MDSPYLNGTSLQRYPCLDLSAIFRLAREKIQKVIFFFFAFDSRNSLIAYSKEILERSESNYSLTSFTPPQIAGL